MKFLKILFLIACISALVFALVISNKAEKEKEKEVIEEPFTEIKPPEPMTFDLSLPKSTANNTQDHQIEIAPVLPDLFNNKAKNKTVTMKGEPIIVQDEKDPNKSKVTGANISIEVKTK